MGRPNQDFPGKPSFLDGIIFEETADEVWICKEQIDTAKLPKLILHAKTKACGTEEEQKRRDRDVILLEGIQRNTSKGGYNVVQFKLKDCGRLYPVDDAPSLQSLSKDYRKALCCLTDTDVDIVNCHPTLLNHILQCEKIAFPLLSEYVMSREKFWALHPNKRRWTELINGSRPQEGEHETVHDFYGQARDALLKLFGLPKFELLFKKGCERAAAKGKADRLGTCVSLLLSHCERECVTAAMRFLKKQTKFNINCVVHDGFHVKAKANMSKGDLKRVARAVEENTCYRFKVQFATKALDDYDKSILHAEEGERGVAPEGNDYENAQAFLAWLSDEGHVLYRVGKEVWWYRPPSEDIALWEGVYSTDLLPLRDHMAQCPHLHADYRTVSKCKEALQRELVSIIDVVDNVDEMIFTSTYQKMAFRNGVYDFSQKKLLPFSPKHFFTFKAKVDYRDDAYIKELAEELKTKLFHDSITEEVTPFWLTSLGRALGGETEDKKLYFLIGEGNSGLGTLTSTLKDTFGRFVGNISCESLAYAGRGDQTKLASFYVPIKAPVRIIYYSEVPNDDSVKLDAGKLKKISGGSDDITARQNFKDEHTFRLQGTLFGTSNFPPRFAGSIDDQFKNRAEMVRAPYSYLPDDSFELRKHEGDHIRRADETLKSVFLKREDVRCAFAWLLVSSYMDTYAEKPKLPPSAYKERDDAFAESDGHLKLSDYFEASDYSADWMSMKQIKAKLASINVSVPGGSGWRLGHQFDRLGFREHAVNKAPWRVRKVRTTAYYHDLQNTF